MNRVIKIVAIFVITFGLFAGGLWAQTKPNVLVILTDDQGYLDLGSYGSKDLVTPNIDRLAEKGVRFTQFYSGAPVCSPSRAAMLTGKYNFNAGLFGNVSPPHQDPEGKSGLPSSEITMAEVFRSNGYRTALIGKWHLGHTVEKLPNGQGFDYFFGHQRGCIDNFSHFFYWSGPNLHDLYQNTEEIHRPGEFFGDLMVEEAKTFMDQASDQPFFMYWAINMPHYPYQGDPRWLEHYADLESPRKEYAAFVSTIDELVGEVYAHLEAIGELENTIIVYQSDHGHSVEERAFFGGGNPGPFSGAKFSMLEGGIRVPAIISYPKILPQNELRHHWANSVDWMPTLAEIAGVRLPEDHPIDGKNLLPLLMDGQIPSPHETMYWATGRPENENHPWAVRKGPWKLLGNPTDPTGKLRFGDSDKLYLVNLETDSTEVKNLASMHPEKTIELHSLYKAWIEAIKTKK
ncbi:Arylsulfatase A [Cyclobacterium xiamenense]|uniref:Arylsulfatase A n=1 Tax=Cyclobacterium xiamenense TaxID=1297121 RepID=A0A1H6UXD6_9BACT|nr:sulfatase-like hydrolase/transferase [Cyclobacterium xiamenense]SEI92685.1 Arylsulfatase A [Cyclobacterium xiamenense]